MPVYIVMIGSPGAGKGTQAEILSQTMSLPHVSSGNIFRENINNRTELGMLVEDILERGELVPDDVTNAMIEERLSRPDCENGAILDGYPRNPVQAHELDEILRKLGGEVNCVPYIKVPKDVLVDRLSSRWTCIAEGHIFNVNFNPPIAEGICDFDGSALYQRDDDRRETVTKRIGIYFEQTAPLVDHYLSQNKLVEIKGDQYIEVVTAELLEALAKVNDNS